MTRKKIIAGLTACIVVFGIIAGVTVALNKDYDDTSISAVEGQSDSESNTETNEESIKVKKAVQSVEYESKLFGDNIINIDIEVDEDEWQNMIANANAEEYISVDVNVNGTVFENVGIRPKGNSSLSTVADAESDKYSFKIKFDKYVTDQTCYGLDKLVLNNVISDNTYMKDYISFDMMKFMNVDSALYNYSYITVNGEYWGLYVALEAYDKSFLNRTYGDDSGFLYNVKSVDAGGMGDMKAEFEGLVTMPEDLTASTGDEIPENEDIEQVLPPENNNAVTGDNIPQIPADGEFTMPEDFNPEDFTMPEGFDENMMQGGMGGIGGGNTGGSLMYTDDDWNSYSSIFENAVFNRTSEEDYQRVITALEKLANGEEIDEYFDVDQILRYLAVHTTLVNLDSYSSNMAQNFYIYEKDGIISILPWDYNLAFGGFSAQDSTSAINFPIDTPVSGVELEDRPLIAKILAVDEYKAKYHEYLQQIVDEYFNSGYFNNKVDELNSKISEYVETEPQAFCTYEEYETAVDTLKTFGELRAESIDGQLKGTIPSTNEEQESDSSKLITDENLNIGDMGSQGGGRGGFGGNGNMQGGFRGQKGDNGQMPFNGEMPSTDMTMPENNENMGTDMMGGNGMPEAPAGDGGNMPPQNPDDDWNNNSVTNIPPEWNNEENIQQQQPPQEKIPQNNNEAVATASVNNRQPDFNPQYH